MTYRAWHNWVFSLPWKFKWFIILILLRPIIDLTWNKKVISSLTLLHIIGVLTPLVILFLFLSRQLPPIIETKSKAVRYFMVWSTFLLLNAILICVTGPTIDRLGIAVKISLPVYLYFFLRHFIWSKKQLEGILQTILYSAIIPAFLLLYEVLVSPFRIERSREVERIMAGYADVVSLGLFILFSMLIASFFFIELMNNALLKRKNLFPIFIIIAFCALALTHINHIASYLTFFALLFLFIFYNFKLGKYGIRIITISLLIIGAIFIQFRVREKVYSLTKTDVMVLRGEKNVDYSFHGRMNRWKRHWQHFTEEISFPEQMIGTIGVIKPYMVGAGVHNDYLRILFTTGYLGSVAYILLLFHIFQITRNMRKSQQFLFRGMLLIILLMSFSTTPTFYILVNYVFVSLLAYIVLPKSLRERNYVKAKDSFIGKTPAAFYRTCSRN